MSMADRHRRRASRRGMISLGPGRFAVGCDCWRRRGCQGETLHDRQHPRGLFMELAATYDRPLVRDIRLQLPGGPVRARLARPHSRIASRRCRVARAHRHHWLDSTHHLRSHRWCVGTRWKAETSVFNGREPDEDRTNFDFGARFVVGPRGSHESVGAPGLWPPD